MQAHGGSGPEVSVFLACRLLTTFANSLDQDQDGQNVGPDLDPKFDTLIVFLNFILKKKSAF